MTRIVLLISFLFFFGRFVYSSIGAGTIIRIKSVAGVIAHRRTLPASNLLILILQAPHSAGRAARC